MTENPINPFLSPNTEKAVIGAALIAVLAIFFALYR